MDTLDLTLNNKPISFTIDTYTDEEGTELYAEASMPEENRESWKQTYFPDIPEKQIYKCQKALDQLYVQLEKELTGYIKQNYPDLDVDWETVYYQELLIMDNNFKMSVMINA